MLDDMDATAAAATTAKPSSDEPSASYSKGDGGGGGKCRCCERHRRHLFELMRIMDDSNRAIARLMASVIDSEESMGRWEKRQVLDRRQEALLQMEWQRANALWQGIPLARDISCCRQ